MTYKAPLEERNHKKVSVTWDGEARAAYIRFVVGKVASTKEIQPGVIADYASNGQLLGVEILNPEEIPQLWPTAA